MTSNQFVRRRAEEEVYIVVDAQSGEKSNAYWQGLSIERLPHRHCEKNTILGQLQKILTDVSA